MCRLPLPAIDGARVAEQMLLGVIHQQRKLYDGAIKHFKAAAEIEANMVYNEPRDWLLNPKTYLGNAYLKIMMVTMLKRFFCMTCKTTTKTAGHCRGLYKALQLQNKNAAAEKIIERLRKVGVKL